METGDSKIRSGTREAATTTSSPKTKFGSTAMFTLVPLYKTSLLLKPTELIINVKGGFWLVVNLKFPLSSVKVPELLPFMVTETAERASFDLLFVMLPVTVVNVWAIVRVEFRASNTNATHK